MTPWTPDDLIAWRHAMTLTQAQASVLLGVSLRTVSSWEKGAVRLPVMLRPACLKLEEEAFDAPKPRDLPT